MTTFKLKLTVALKLIVVLLVFLAIIDLHYEYYMILRWSICSFAIWQVIESYRNQRIIWVITYSSIAILFNPISIIHFIKSVWIKLDLITGIVIIISLILDFIRKDKGI